VRLRINVAVVVQVLFLLSIGPQLGHLVRDFDLMESHGWKVLLHPRIYFTHHWWLVIRLHIFDIDNCISLTYLGLHSCGSSQF